MMKKALNAAFYVVALFYAVLMLDLLFKIGITSSGKGTSRSYNLIPFHTIRQYVSGDSGVARARAVQNIGGNIAVFIPYGLYLQVLLKNKGFGKSLWIVAGTSIAVEVLQYAFGVGAADIDDVLLNACGGAIGILGYKLLRTLFPEPDKAKAAVTLLSLAVGVPVLLIYARAFLRMLL
ncbi:MAG: VanZ family protein [Candidatus Limiplasma sp.]|nr:VanZ family protein [Candidatus Limiplasma sp.]